MAKQGSPCYQAIAIWVTLLSLMLSLPVKAQTDAPNFSTAHRAVVDAASYPWSAIGRINISGVSNRTHCTGSLIGEKVVLTAAHCLYYQPTSRFVPPEFVHFVAGYQLDKFQAHSIAENLIIAPGFNPENWSANSNLAHDWALVILKDPIGKVGGFLGYQSLDKDSLDEILSSETSFVLAGYPYERAHVISVDNSCRIDRYISQGALLGHSCTIVGGDSGAPIAIQVKNGLQVVALNSAYNVTLSDASLTNSAVPIQSLLEAIKTAISETEENPLFHFEHGRSGSGPTE